MARSLVGVQRTEDSHRLNINRRTTTPRLGLTRRSNRLLNKGLTRSTDRGKARDRVSRLALAGTEETRGVGEAGGAEEVEEVGEGGGGVGGAINNRMNVFHKHSFFSSKYAMRGFFSFFWKR